MGDKIGLECKAFFGDALMTGTDQAAIDAVTWTEMDNIKDVNQNSERTLIDKSTRGSGYTKQYRVAHRDGGIEFEMNWNTSDAAFTALQTADANDTEISMAFLDGDIDTAGSQGWAGNYRVANFSREEPLDGMVVVKVKVVPSSQNKWVTIAS